MPRWKVFVAEQIPAVGLEWLRAHDCDVRVHPHQHPPTRDELLAAVPGCDGLLPTINQAIDEPLLAAAGPSLRVVANFGVGVNNIDLAAATRRGILVTNTPGVLTEATADLAFALILAVARRVVEGDRMVRAGAWPGWRPLQLLGADVSGRTLGIVGAGRIGTAVGRRAAGFGMPILYVARRPNADVDALGGRRVSLDEALRESDFVSLHVPLTDRTRHLIGGPELKAMKPSAFLINTSRGPVVDEAALVEALRAGTIRGAGLDVYENEPRLAPGLADLPSVICLPHLGSATESTRARMAELAARNLVSALEGNVLPNLVNPEALAPRCPPIARPP